jgi:hypothetical protein
MATATTNTTGRKETPDLAQKIREQLASTVSQRQQFSVDAAQAWVEALWVLPASDLLMAQFDYALQLADVVITDKHDSPMPLPDW